MSRFISDASLDLILIEIKDNVEEEAVCSSQPLTYFNACYPDMWVAATVYDVGDLVRPPTDNGYIYECTVGGTSDVSEPPWGTSQDAEFSDNTITWKTHLNFALINELVDPGDMSIDDGAIDGRTLTIAEQTGITIHTDGTVGHTALINNTTREIVFVDTAQTSLVGDNNVLSGRTTLLHEMKINMRDPSAP